jgi:hypothetical protein
MGRIFTGSSSELDDPAVKDAIIVSQSRTPINTSVSALFYEGSDST